MRDGDLIEKFTVYRNDGSSAAGQKHERCEYFVLDLDHDRHAIAALAAYIESCKADFPKLARSLELRLHAMQQADGR